MQYSILVRVVGVNILVESVYTLLGTLIGGVHTISVYDRFRLLFADEEIIMLLSVSCNFLFLTLTLCSFFSTYSIFSTRYWSITVYSFNSFSIDTQPSSSWFNGELLFTAAYGGCLGFFLGDTTVAVPAV
jgi:hypothetical protein